MTTERAAAGDVLAAALAYAARGWPVFPVRGKVPLTARGFLDASSESDHVRAWFDVHRGAGVAIATGAVSGLVVVDEDTPKGGRRSLAELEQKIGRLPATLEVLTGGGGKHYYFKHPGTPVSCSAGKLGPGLDVRADGGFVVAAPSPHQSGRPYKLVHERELAELPAVLLELLSGGRENGARPAGKVGDVIPQGKRDATLASLAGSMRRRGMAEPEILAALKATNLGRCRPPLAERDVERIAASVARYEPDRPEELFALEVLTAREVVALPDPSAEDEQLGPLVVRGQRIVIGGHTGEGKTTIALAIQRAAVLGEIFLGWEGRGGARGLFLDAEQGLRSIKRRLREAGLDECDAIDYVRVPDGLSLDTDARHVAEVERVLDAGGYSVVAADPLYKLHAGDSNAEREAVDLMRRFDVWRERFGFALILPIHCRKPLPRTKFSIHDLFGSSAYVRGAEVVLGLQRLRSGYSRLHFLKDRDGDLPIGEAWGLLFDRGQGFRRDPEDGNKEPTTVEQVRDLLEQTAMTKAQLVEATGKKPRSVESALRDVGATSKRPGGAGGHGENVYSLPTDSQPARTQLALESDGPE